MRRALAGTLATCLLLAACASQPHPAHAPRATLEAVHDTTLIPLPVHTSLLTAKAQAGQRAGSDGVIGTERSGVFGLQGNLCA
mgnify:CR=1 FL=1